VYVINTWTPHIYGWAWGFDAKKPCGGMGEYVCNIKELRVKSFTKIKHSMQIKVLSFKT